MLLLVYLFIGFVVVVCFFVFAVFPVFRMDMRRRDRRSRRLFAPIERRRKARRRQGAFVDLRWAVRYRLNQFKKAPARKPQSP